MKSRRRVNPFEAVQPELPVTLKPIAELLNSSDVSYALIGGMALGFYFPRYPTDDIDIAVEKSSEIPDLTGLNFRRKSQHRYEDRRYGIEVDFITFDFINVPYEVMQHTIKTSQVYYDSNYGIPLTVATPLSIFAIKLCRYRDKDRAHLLWMIRHAYIPRDDSLIEAGVPENIVHERMTELLNKHRQEEESEGKMGW